MPSGPWERSAAYGHPDPEREGLRRVLLDGSTLLTVARAGELFAFEESLGELLSSGRSPVFAAVARALRGVPLTAPAKLLPPVDVQEVWASGVTYRRSAS